jgi:hypothetical protein
MGMRADLPLLATATLGLALSCATSPAPPDTALEGLALDAVNPGLVIPGSTLDLEGDSFVDADWGTTTLRLRGALGGTPIDVSVPARFVDYDHLTVTVDEGFVTLLGGIGDFTGEAIVEVVSADDGKLYASAPLAVTLALRDQLQPLLEELQTGGLIFVNDLIAVAGDGLLLGGDEGTTYAVVSGCFTPAGEADCAPVGPLEVPVSPEDPYDRGRGTFAFAPAIAGIQPGVFAGSVLLRNRHAGGAAPESQTRAADYELIPPAAFSVSTTAVSLGQYVDITGGGFVGGEPGASTLLRLTGTYTPTGAPQGGPVDLLLVPEFASGRLVRYVLNEDDALGQALDLRRDTGVFVGELTPEISYGGVDVIGDATAMTLSIAPVRQVVWLDFRPSYVESLRNFGLRAADSLIRARVIDVLERAYRTINVDIRTEEPTDFKLYSIVEIHGPDLNGMGLFGYDNSPGKDTDNDRLYDRLGGVNAMTQEDGYPGYGGVFIDSLFGFSEHPGDLADSLPGADAAFDTIFDAFRPDLDGTAVSASDFSADLPSLDSGDGCPATDRATRIACAVWVMGSLVGGTLAHEIGHSLGLANPYGEGFHDLGDAVNRLMDGGSERSFLERAELFGQGPSDFCDTEYAYLRAILPTSEPDDPTVRATCF